MSYSVSVYAKRSIPAAKLQATFADAADFTKVDDTRLEHVDADGLLILAGPLRVEPEDVPAEVLALAPVTYQYTFTFRTGVGHDLARRLAESLDGVLYDEEVLRAPRDVLPKAVKPAAHEPLDVIQLSWFVPPRADTTPARLYWEAATRWLPDALPARFGEDEPFQGKAADSGVAGMEDAWQQHHLDVGFICARYPFIEGSVGTPDRPEAIPAWRILVTVAASPFQDAGWRELLQGFFVGLAETAGALHAIAEVQTGYTLSRGRLWRQGTPEPSASPWSPAGFCGLAKHPVWWSWFGPAYQPLLADRFARKPAAWALTPTTTGTLLSLHDTPVPRRALQPYLFGRPVAADWFSPQLLPRSGRTHWKQPARVVPQWPTQPFES
ncbi:MAG: hypothetical protein KDB60_03145 [Propionibacteriaceae bacterium]|nr:hypothetical protein [Propionibacteriaceae bacterium]